jgi:hypothetical protein
MRIQEYGCFKTDFDTLTAALRTLPVERSPWNDIYQSDIGIQFQKGLEHFWDKVPTGDGGGGLRAYLSSLLDSLFPISSVIRIQA